MGGWGRWLWGGGGRGEGVMGRKCVERVFRAWDGKCREWKAGMRNELGEGEGSVCVCVRCV